MQRRVERKLERRLINATGNIARSAKCLAFSLPVSVMAFSSDVGELRAFSSGLTAYIIFKSLPSLNNLTDKMMTHAYHRLTQHTSNLPKYFDFSLWYPSDEGRVDGRANNYQDNFHPQSNED